MGQALVKSVAVGLLLLLCAHEFCGRWKTGFLVEKMFVGRAENTDFVNNISIEERNVGWKM
jgi:hypothetical protein